jgi:hypothetical protein
MFVTYVHNDEFPVCTANIIYVNHGQNDASIMKCYAHFSCLQCKVQSTSCHRKTATYKLDIERQTTWNHGHQFRPTDHIYYYTELTKKPVWITWMYPQNFVDGIASYCIQWEGFKQSVKYVHSINARLKHSLRITNADLTGYQKGAYCVC